MPIKKFKAEKKNLEHMLNFIMEVLSKTGTSPDIQKKIYVVSEEILINIIKYAYTSEIFKEEDKIVIIKLISSDKNDITIIFLDYGEEYDFYSMGKGSLKDFNEKGIGVFIAKSLADKIEYKRSIISNILSVFIKNAK